MTQILPLAYCHCPDVSRLHLSNLRSRFAGLPGERLLRVYYATIADGHGACGYVAESNQVVVGYVCGVWDPHLLHRALLKKRWLELMVWSMLQILVAPRLVFDFARRVVASPSATDAHSGYELRPIVMAPSARSTGLSTELVNVLLSDAAKREERSIWLVTEADNAPANAFYFKMGFIKTGLLERHGTPYVRYEREINKG